MSPSNLLPVITRAPSDVPDDPNGDISPEAYAKLRSVEPPQVLKENSLTRLETAKLHASDVFRGHVTGNYYAETEDAVTGIKGVEVIASRIPSQHGFAPQPRIIKDFSLLGLDFLLDTPTAPRFTVTFCYAIGDYEICCHKIIPGSRVIYLLRDTRYVAPSRFKPKASMDILTVEIDGHKHTGYLWTEGQFCLGCLEITPFVRMEVPQEETVVEENITVSSNLDEWIEAQEADTVDDY